MTKQEAKEIIQNSGVSARQIWRHCKGDLYYVLDVGLDEPTLAPVVIYLDTQTEDNVEATVWVRRLDVFLERFTPFSNQAL
jgi:hypothetical protein